MLVLNPIPIFFPRLNRSRKLPDVHGQARLELSTQKLVQAGSNPPYSWATGLRFMAPGTFWPSSSSAEQGKMYNLVVLAVKMSKATPSSSMVPRFKIYLVPDDDFSLTGNLDLKENTNWWWVDLNVFSKAYFEDKAREDARKAEADAARAAEEPRHEPAPPPSTMAELRANVFGQLFEKIPGKKRKTSGYYYKCTHKSCEKREDPYFVGAGESSLNVTSVFVILIF